MNLNLLPLLLLALPLAEIATFIYVGSRIGVLATIGLIVATSIAGAILLRIQGLGTMTRIRQVVDSGGVPSRELVHGVMILAAGALLLAPGFITDSLGILLFIPAIREVAWRFLRSRITVIRPRGSGPDDHRTIDLDEDEYSRGERSSRDPDPNRTLR